jgi:hypothetical protein
MTASLSFVQYTTANQIQSGIETIKNFRKFYPDNFYMLICDAGSDYYEVCKQYNIEYYHSQRFMGYPKEPYGYEVGTVLEFWERFYIACLRCGTTHIMYVEEDNRLIRPVTFPEDVEIYGYQPHWPDGSPFPITGFTEEFKQILYQYSGVYPNVNGYGAGAGTIYKVQTFLDNFFRIKEWMLANFDHIKYNVYPKMGWQDSYGTYFYLLAGKPFTINPRVVNLADPSGTNAWDHCGRYEYPKIHRLYNHVPEDVEILHNYKCDYVR